jgi:hypothetical protein
MEIIYGNYIWKLYMEIPQLQFPSLVVGRAGPGPEPAVAHSRRQPCREVWGAKPPSPCTPAGAQMGPSNSHTSGVHIYIIYIYIYSFFSCKSRNDHGPVYPTVMGRSTPDSSKLASEQTCLTCLHISEARACTTRGGFTSLSEVKQAESCITAW